MRQYYFTWPWAPDPVPYEDVLRQRIRPIVAVHPAYPPYLIEDTGGSWDASGVV